MKSFSNRKIIRLHKTQVKNENKNTIMSNFEPNLNQHMQTYLDL